MVKKHKKPKIKKSSKLKTCGIIFDAHIPYEDKIAYELMIQVFKDIGLDELYLTGDFADFYGINQHGPLDPNVVESFEDEIEAVNKRLDELDNLFGSIKKTLCVGNHCTRLQRFLHKNAHQLIPFADIKDLFKMHSRPNWKWIPYGPEQKASVGGSKLMIRHEPTGSNFDRTLRRSMCSVVHGHTHKAGMSFAVDMNGQEHVAFSAGWIGDKRIKEIFGYCKNHQDWNLGFSIVHVDPVTKNFYPQIIRILDDYSCSVNGKKYSYDKKG